MKRPVLLFLLLVSACGLSRADVTVDEQNFPDKVFREYVSLYAVNGVITSDKIPGITRMSLDSLAIADLTGIENFTELIYLEADHCKLTSLDLSHNTKLTEVYCGDNLITDLNVRNCKSLRELWAFGNRLEHLDLSDNTALEVLHLYDNKLVSINLSNLKSLKFLSLNDNQLQSLDVSNKRSLFSLDCAGNLLTSLNLSNDTYLRDLRCGKNRLVSLDLSSLSKLSTLWCYENKLTEIKMPSNISIYFHDLWIMQNQIKREQMEKIIEALPVRDTDFPYFQVYLNDMPNYPEGNEITAEQVSKASSKKWTPTYYDAASNKWLPYQGIQPTVGSGDLNGDGIVDVTDVNSLIDMVLGKTKQNQTADVNGDGLVDVSDVNSLIDHILGK